MIAEARSAGSSAPGLPELTKRLGRRALSDLEHGTIVVLPSLSFPVAELKKITGIQHYEERMMFVLLWLSKPELKVVYLSSAPIDPAIVDYYLTFVSAADARSRLKLITLDDEGVVPLSEKLIARREVLDEVRGAVGDASDAYILPFNVTRLETTIAHEIGIPIYGPALDHIVLGSKTGARLVADEAGVQVPDGAEGLVSIEEVGRAIERLRSRRPDLDAVVVKLNNGFSGQGNMILELADFRLPLDSSPVVFCSEEESWPSFSRKVAEEGAIVEELIRLTGTVSPSVQLRIAPNRSFEVISTHDQILGGPDAQVYLGCTFPAREGYRLELQKLGLKIAEVLASKGVVGQFGVDFVVVPGDGGHDIYLTEINLRSGGTTHPFFMARFATGGSYDPSSGHLVAGGRPKFYVASDNLKSERYLGLRPAEVVSRVARAGMAYNHDTKTGVTLHLLGAVTHHGKFGGVCIGDSPDEAEDLYLRVAQIA